MVEFDSIIPPGQVGKIKPQIKMREGTTTFRKSVTVYSNAKNTESIVLNISGKLLNIVDVSESFLHMIPDKDGKMCAKVLLSTAKKDFAVDHMVFQETKTDNTPSWQANVPIAVTYKVTKSEKPDADGYLAYTVDFSMDMAPPNTITGEFVITTNHPEKKTINIRGMLEPKEQPKPKKY